MSDWLLNLAAALLIVTGVAHSAAGRAPFDCATAFEARRRSGQQAGALHPSLCLASDQRDLGSSRPDTHSAGSRSCRRPVVGSRFNGRGLHGRWIVRLDLQSRPSRGLAAAHGNRSRRAAIAHTVTLALFSITPAVTNSGLGLQAGEKRRLRQIALKFDVRRLLRLPPGWLGRRPNPASQCTSGSRRNHVIWRLA